MSFFKDLKNKIKPEKAAELQVIKPSEDREDGFLQGNFLVSTTLIQEKAFHHSVILIVNHDKHGAMGLVINKEIKTLKANEVLKTMEIEGELEEDAKLTLYNGGPVEPERGFVIHSDDYKTENTVTYPNGIAISSEKKAIQDFVNGEGAKNMCLVMGYAGWVAGQLEEEIESGSWITVPAKAEIIFAKNNDSKWQKAANELGVDIFKLTPFIGNA